MGAVPLQESAISLSREASVAVLNLIHPATTQSWQRRRHERLQIEDDRGVRRSVRTEVDLAPLDQAEIPTDGRDIFLPIGIFPRQSHTDVSVSVDGDVQRLTFDEERAIVTEGLIGLWADLEVDLESHRDALAQILRRKILRSRIAEASIRQVSQAASLEVEISELVDAAVEDPDRTEVARALHEDLLRWSHKHLLVIRLPQWQLLDVHGAGAFDITTEYLEALPSRVAPKDGSLGARFIATFRHVRGGARRVLAGSTSWSTRIPLAGVTDARSFHCSIDAPSGLRAVDCAARVRYEIKPESATKQAAAATKQVEAVKDVWYRDDDRLPSSAHLFISTRRRVVVDAELIVHFYANRSGLWSEAVALTVLIALVFDWIYRGLSDTYYATGSALSTGLDANFGSTLLLLLPAIVLTVISQRDGHRLNTKAFALTRFSLGVLASACILAASLLTVTSAGWSPGFADLSVDLELKELWTILRFVVLTVAARVLLGAVIHLWRLSTLRTAMVRVLRAIRDGVAANPPPQNGQPRVADPYSYYKVG